MDDVELDKMFEDLKTYVIYLDNFDNPKYFQAKVDECRRFLNETSSYVQKVHQAIRQTTFQVDSLQAQIEIARDDLLDHEEVRCHAHMTDRLAAVNRLLADDIKSLKTLERKLKSLTAALKVAKFRHDELKSTMSDIRLKRSLMRDEFDTGTYYGQDQDAHKLPQEKTPLLPHAEILSIKSGHVDPNVASSTVQEDEIESLYDYS